MKWCVSILGLSLLWPPTPARAQFTRAEILRNLIELAPNEAGITMGEWSTITRDVEVAKRFWVNLGGTPINVDGTVAVKFHGVLVFLRKGEPAGEMEGTIVNHIGFRVPHGDAFVAKLRAAGVKTDPDAGVKQGGFQGMGMGNVYSPDGLKVELLHDDNLILPIVSDHIHFAVSSSDADKMQAWYVTTFRAKGFIDNATNPGRSGGASADLPGIELKFGKASQTTLPTKGRTLDHVGFEVKNLEAFCKKLQASGTKLDQPYSKTRHAGYASAELTDPWGTSIELTEGLSR